MKSLYQKCIEIVSRLNLNTAFLPKIIQSDIEFTTNIEAGGLYYKFDNIENAILIQKDFRDKSIIALDIYKLLNINSKTPLHVRLLEIGEAVDISINFNFISYVNKNQTMVWALSIIKRNFFTKFLNVSNVEEHLQVHINSIIKKIIKRIKNKIAKNTTLNPFYFFEDINIDENEIYNTFIILKHNIEKNINNNVKYYLKEINPRFYVVQRNIDKKNLYSIVVGNILNCDISKKKWYYDEDEVFNNNGVVLYNYCYPNNIEGVCEDENRIYLKPKKNLNYYSGLILCGEQNSTHNYSSVMEEKKYYTNINLPPIPDLEDKYVLN